jgi:hypothetical protein
VVKESELYVILRKLDSKKIKGDVRVYTEPRWLHNSVTDMPTSQVRVRHVFVLTADRRTDLVGRLLLHVHPTISMTHMIIEHLVGVGWGATAKANLVQ